MAVFRVERNKGYTVMSNHHLRNKELTLKAKGLLSQMLSLPEDWDYTLAGLSQINREKIDAIREAIKELERAGYIVRSRERDAKGRLRGADYVIYEQPHTEPTPDLPTLENPTQLNKDIQKTDLPKKEKINTDLQSTHSIPILSPNPSPSDGEAATPPERKRKETETQTAFEIYREIIKDNISYDILMQDMKFDRDRLDEIVDIMLETVCTRRKTIRIAGDDYPAELVKAKFMKLDGEHIRFVLDCMRENTTKIRNIKQYLRAVLFNAPSTIGNYYTSLVAHDIRADRQGREPGQGDKEAPPLCPGAACTGEKENRPEESGGESKRSRIGGMSMNKYNNFTVEETNLLSIYMTGSKEGLVVAMNAALPFMEGEMRDFAARTLAKVGRMTEAEFAGLALYPADEV